MKSIVVGNLEGELTVFAVGLDNQVYKLNFNSSGDRVDNYVATNSGAIL